MASSSSSPSAAAMVPGMRDDVGVARVGYASDECRELVPLCVEIAHTVRDRTRAAHVKVSLDVLVENGLVIPIRIAEIAVETSLLKRFEAAEKLLMIVSAFAEYTDYKTELWLNGKAVDGPEGRMLPEAKRCAYTSTVVLGPIAKRTGVRIPRRRRLLRLAAKSVVWSGLANRCLLWVRGKQVFIDTFRTALLPEDEILQLLCSKFELIQDGEDEDLIEALEQDVDVDPDDDPDAVDLEPRVSRYARYANDRTRNMSRAYPIVLSDYRNCDPQPIIAAVRDGWCFLFGAEFLGSVHMHPVSPRRKVPDHICKPEWAYGGLVYEHLQESSRKSIQMRSPEEVANMRLACSIARAALDAAAAMVRPGINTDAIDEVVHNTIIAHGAYPSWLRFGAKGRTKSCCTSVNEVLCRGIPDSRPLREGDIVAVYVAAFARGVHGAVSDTFCVGKVDDVSKRLVRCSRECLDKIVTEVRRLSRSAGVAYPRPGAIMTDHAKVRGLPGSGGVPYPRLGAIMTDHAESFGFKPSTVPLYAGIGTRLLSAPRIPQYCPRGKRGSQLKRAEWLQPGHTFFLEPLIIAGECQSVVEWPRGALVNKHGDRSASTGKTVLVTATGLEVL